MQRLEPAVPGRSPCPPSENPTCLAQRKPPHPQGTMPLATLGILRLRPRAFRPQSACRGSLARSTVDSSCAGHCKAQDHLPPAFRHRGWSASARAWVSRPESTSRPGAWRCGGQSEAARREVPGCTTEAWAPGRASGSAQCPACQGSVAEPWRSWDPHSRQGMEDRVSL